MRKIGILFFLLAAMSGLSYAQTAPGTSIGSSIGVTGGQSLTGQTNIVMADANYTMVPNEWWAGTLYVSSSASLTATRNLIAPANAGQHYCVENLTSGGQSIQLIAPSGTGVIIPQFAGTETCVTFNGTNYFASAAATVSLQVNSSPTTSQTVHNEVNSSANVAGLTDTVSNPSGGIVRHEIGGSVNASHGGTGIDTSGSTGCPSVASGTWSINGCGATPISSFATTDCTSGASTLLITSSLTVTGTATITKCNLLFQGAGALTGSGTFACAQCAITNTGGGAVFGASLVITGLQYDRLSWHSLLGYTSTSAASAGADYSVPIQQAVNAVSNTGTLYIPCLVYRADSTITITTYVNITGECLTNISSHAVFVSNSATANQMSISTASPYLAWGSVQHLTLQRMTKPTGTIPTTGVGFSVVNTGGWVLNDLYAYDSNDTWYLSLFASFGNGSIKNVGGGWTLPGYSSADTNLNCFDIAPPDALGNQSAILSQYSCSGSAIKSTGAHTAMVNLHGKSLNDITFENGNAADTTDCANVTQTSGNSIPANDIFFKTTICQSTNAFQISDVGPAGSFDGAGIMISNTWDNTTNGSTITRSRNIFINGYQAEGAGSTIKLVNSNANTINGAAMEHGTGVTLDGSSNNYVQMTIQTLSSGSQFTNGVDLKNSSINNEIHVQCIAYGSTCVNADATSQANWCVSIISAGVTRSQLGITCSSPGLLGLSGSGNDRYTIGTSTTGFGANRWGFIYNEFAPGFTALWSTGTTIASNYSLFTMPTNGGWGWGNQASNAVTGSWACDTQLFRISSGEVGINTCGSATNPSTGKLDIGQINIYPGASATGIINSTGIGIGTTAPGSWLSVVGAGGTNIQAASAAGNARVIINGSTGAELHIVNTTAAAGSRAMRLYNDTSGVFHINTSNDGYTVNTDGLTIAPVTAAVGIPVSLALHGGTAMNGNQGNGTLVQHSTGSVTSGHIATFDANGNTVDGGAVPSSGLSGMTSGQVAIAGSGTTITSSKVLAGAGAGVTTGPTTSTNGNVTTFTGTGGQVADSGTSLASLAPLASPGFSGTPTAPTQSALDNSTRLATTGYVDSAVIVANSLTPGSDLSGSRAIGTVYHNGAARIILTGSLGTTGSSISQLHCVIGSTSTPSLVTYSMVFTATTVTGSAGFKCEVPANWYYEITQDGGAYSAFTGINTWFEETF